MLWMLKMLLDTWSANLQGAAEVRGSPSAMGRVCPTGQLNLNLQTQDDAGRSVPVRSTFQVAEIKRPLMSVAKVCENGNTCVFTKDGAKVLDKDNKTVCKFEKKNGLYVCNMKLKPPKPFTRPAR